MYAKKINIAGVDHEIETTIVGTGAPGPLTEGNIGQFYMDEETHQIYKCVGETPDAYEWDNVIDSDALARLATSVGADLEYNESNETLYLVNNRGSLIGNGTHIRVGLSGLEIVTEDGFDDEGDPVQYIALYDSDHNLISRTEIAISGGGGGGGGGDIMRLVNTTTVNGVLTNSLNSVLGDPDGVTISYQFSITDANGEPVSDIGTARYYNDGVLIGYGPVDQGNVSVTFKSGEGEKLHAGNNVIRVAVEDSNGNKRSISYYVTVINLTLTSDFDASAPFEQENIASGEVVFRYTPYGGDIEKTVHFELDGRERDTVVTRRSGEPQTYSFGGLSHGHHSLRCWMTAELMGHPITSNVLFFDFLYVRSGNNSIIMAVDADYSTVMQGDVLTFPYLVYGRQYTECAVMYTIEVERPNAQTGNNEWRTSYTSPVYTSDRTRHIITVRDAPTGNVRIRFFAAVDAGHFNLVNPSREFYITVLASDIALTISTDGIDLMLDAFGRTNTETGNSIAVWRDSANNLASDLVDFDFKTNGWMRDTDGSEALKVSGGANVTVPYRPFAVSPIATGGAGITIELDFMTDEVSDSDAVLISCMGNGMGFRVKAQEIEFRTSAQKVSTPFEPGKRTRVAFVVEAPGSRDHLIHMYVNGVDGSGEGIPAYDYRGSEFLQQSEPISVSSAGAAIWIYGIRVYTTAKDRINVLMNYLASIPSVVEQTQEYNRNQIFDANTGEITQSALHDSNPDLTIVMLAGPRMPEAKVETSGAVTKTDRTVSGQIIDPDPNLCVTFENQKIAVQGTSSAGYYRKNYKLTVKKCYLASDQTQEFPGYKIRSDSMYAQKLCFKKDVASSEQANNVLLARLYNDLCPDSPAQEVDSHVRQGIDGKPCVIFFTCTDPGLPEYTDGQPVFFGKYNLNIDKGSENVFGFDQEDENEAPLWPNAQSWEFRNNSSPACNFKEVDFVSKENGDFKWKNNFEARYPDGSEDTARFAALCAWIQSTDPEQADDSALGTAYYVTPTAQKGLMKDAVEYAMYETENRQAAIRTVMKDGIERKVVSRTRYVTETITVDGHDYTVLPVDAQGNELYYYTHNTAQYREERFYQELEDHFDVDSLAFYYVFTEFFLMVDNRAKNQFLTTYDGEKWMFLPYDFDTALGINNEGKLAFSYGLEATDTVDGAYVFNDQMQSVLWNNFMATCGDKIDSTFRSFESSVRIDPDALISYFSGHQNMWPIALWNHDENWTYSPTETGSQTYLEMWQGKKETQREWWLRRRYIYMCSKYLSTGATGDRITLRVYTPDPSRTEDPDEAAAIQDSIEAVPPSTDFTITPYQDVYLNVMWGSWTRRARAREDVPVLMQTREEAGRVNDAETYIYSAHAIKKLGDLSGCYCGYIDISNAVHLEELILGNEDTDYVNLQCTSVTVGNNTALKMIDVRGLAKFTSTLNLSNCPNIEEVYAERTGLTAVSTPNGGCLRVLHLPETVEAISVRNQTSLEDFDCDGYANVNYLSIENCPLLEAQLDDILAACVNLTNIRLSNVDWNEDTAERLVALASLGGLDEYGQTTPHASISGTVHIANCTSDQLSTIRSAFPELTVTYTSASARLTFVNAVNENGEGGETLYELDIPYGGSGYDPYLRGEIQMPTLDSTAQYEYTFSGWEGSLYNVTASRTITATYDAAVRTYGVTWKNGNSTLGYGADGTDNANGQDVPYGTVLRYGRALPTKQDKVFAGWTFKNTDDENTETTTATEALTMTVNGTTVVEATFVTFAVPATKKAFEDCTWTEIMALAESARRGTLQTDTGYATLSAYGWEIGDAKTMTLKNGDEVEMKIWAFDTSKDEDGNTLPVTIGAIHRLSETRQLDVELEGLRHCFDYTVSDEAGDDPVTNRRTPEDRKAYYESGTPMPGETNFIYDVSGPGDVTIDINGDTQLTSLTVTTGGKQYVYYFNGYRNESNTSRKQDVNYFGQEDCVDENGDSVFTQRARYVVNSGPAHFSYQTRSGEDSPEIVVDGTDGDITVYDEYYNAGNSLNAYRNILFTEDSKIVIPFTSAGSIAIGHRGVGNWGGFEVTGLRYWLNRDFLDQMPAIVQLHLAPVKRVSVYGGSMWDKTVTYYDKIILPNYVELGYPTTSFYAPLAAEGDSWFDGLASNEMRALMRFPDNEHQTDVADVIIPSVSTVLLGYFRAITSNGSNGQILIGQAYRGGVLPGFCPGYIEEGGLE